MNLVILIIATDLWFFFIYLYKDGMWGLTYEHSAGEAPAIFKAFEDLTEKVDSMSPPDENLVPSHLPAPEKLEWCLTEQSLNDIREAMMNFDAWVLGRSYAYHLFFFIASQIREKNVEENYQRKIDSKKSLIFDSIWRNILRSWSSW